MKVDIVGGSLAGLSTAISIKKLNQNIEVLIHEKYKKIGYNHEGRRCGEAHSIDKQWSKWIPEKKSYFNEITKGIGYVGKKVYTYNRKPGTAFILNRPEFIAQLGRETKKLGAIIQTNDKIKSVNDLDGDYIVDASGCPSVIKREFGFNKGFKGVSYQQTLENANCFEKNIIKLFYSGNCGYFWIFPRDPGKKEINVGVGYIKNFNYNLKENLEEFKDKQKITGKINYVTGGLIPVGLQRPFKYRNILFVGDACVGTFPLSGQGIYRALLSGDIAGRCIVKNQTNKYSWIINHEFIKWDIIGSTFNYSNLIFKRINPNIVLTNLNYITKFCRGLLH